MTWDLDVMKCLHLQSNAVHLLLRIPFFFDVLTTMGIYSNSYHHDSVDVLDTLITIAAKDY